MMQSTPASLLKFRALPVTAPFVESGSTSLSIHG